MRQGWLRTGLRVGVEGMMGNGQSRAHNDRRESPESARVGGLKIIQDNNGGGDNPRDSYSKDRIAEEM